MQRVRQKHMKYMYETTAHFAAVPRGRYLIMCATIYRM